MSHATVMVAIDGAVKPEGLNDEVDKAMAPFNENGAMFEDGSRWDWYVVGGRWKGMLNGKDILRKKDIDVEQFKADVLKERTETYQRAMANKGDIRELLYGVKKGESLEDFLARAPQFPSTYAFLQMFPHEGGNTINWHERERLGWFGMSAKTECEVKTGVEGGRCLFKTEGDGINVKIVSWGTDNDQWNAKFFDRFVAPLHPDTWLVVVDYHV